MNHVCGSAQDFDNHLKHNTSAFEPEMCVLCLEDPKEPGHEECLYCLTNKD